MQRFSGGSLPRYAWRTLRSIASNWCLPVSRCSCLPCGTMSSTGTRTGFRKTSFSLSCMVVWNSGGPSVQVRSLFTTHLVRAATLLTIPSMRETSKVAIPPRSAKLESSRSNSPSPSLPPPCTAKTLKTLKATVSQAAAPSQSCSPSPPASSSAWVSPYGHTSSAASGTSIGTVRSHSWRMDVSSEDGSCACARATQTSGRASITV